MDDNFTYPPGTILGAILGSHAQGFATEFSDVDRGCVYLMPVMDILTWPGKDAPDMSIQKHDPDCWGHELRKFVHLARGCHPAILELLWADETTDLITDYGRMLRQVREMFLSSRLIMNAFSGAATQNLGRAADGSHRKVKSRRHALRLLSQAQLILTTGEFAMQLPEDARAVIVKASEALTDDEFLKLFESMKEKVRQCETTSPLPKSPQRGHYIEMTVEAIRRGQIYEELL